MTTKPENRRRFIAALAVVLIGTVGALWLLTGKMRERTEFIGQIDPKSGYRCRFTISPTWREQTYGRPQEKNDIDLKLFTARPPSPIQKWIRTYLFRPPSPAPVLPSVQIERQISLESMAATAPGFQFGQRFYLQDGYPEPEGLSHDTILKRHLRIDGCPSTFLTVEYLFKSLIGPSRYRATILLVSPSDGSALYCVEGFAEPPDFEAVQHEMEAIASSFHVEKVSVPPGSKR